MKRKNAEFRNQMKMVRLEQCEGNMKKSMIAYVVCFLLGLSFVIQIMCGLTKGVFANPRIKVLANSSMIFGLIGSVLWLIVRPKKGSDQSKMSLPRYIFNRLFSYAPLLFVTALEIDMIISTQGTSAPFVLLIVTVFFFIAFYDINVNDFFLYIVLVVSLVLAGSKGNALSLEFKFSSIMFIIASFLIEFMIDHYSHVNCLQRMELEKANDKMKEAVDTAVGELRKQTEKVAMIQTEIVDGLANLIESRSGETGGHVKRTKDIVSMITRRCIEQGKFSHVLTPQYASLTERAAVLHDIGKISISDTILNAPRRLTPEEFEEMKLHTTYGAKIVSEILKNVEDQEYLTIAIQIARSHHERYDGTGYPQGLAGEAIPLCARVMAIADVYDALVSERCYKKPMPAPEALRIIKEGAGTQFDPELVGVFLNCMNSSEHPAGL